MDIREKSSNKKRLIDVDALLEKMKRTSRYFDVLFDVEEMPTVDAVEVVRCRECKYRFGNNGHSKNGCPIIDANIWMDDDDFCSYGERKEGAD